MRVQRSQNSDYPNENQDINGEYNQKEIQPEQPHAINGEYNQKEIQPEQPHALSKRQAQGTYQASTFEYMTKDEGRLPTLYFRDGDNTSRIRLQHRTGPVVRDWRDSTSNLFVTPAAGQSREQNWSDLFRIRDYALTNRNPPSIDPATLANYFSDRTGLDIHADPRPGDLQIQLIFRPPNQQEGETDYTLRAIHPSGGRILLPENPFTDEEIQVIESTARRAMNEQRELNPEEMSQLQKIFDKKNPLPSPGDSTLTKPREPKDRDPGGAGGMGGMGGLGAAVRGAWKYLFGQSSAKDSRKPFRSGGQRGDVESLFEKSLNNVTPRESESLSDFGQKGAVAQWWQSGPGAYGFGKKDDAGRYDGGYALGVTNEFVTSALGEEWSGYNGHVFTNKFGDPLFMTLETNGGTAGVNNWVWSNSSNSWEKTQTISFKNFNSRLGGENTPEQDLFAMHAGHQETFNNDGTWLDGFNRSNLNTFVQSYRYGNTNAGWKWGANGEGGYAIPVDHEWINKSFGDGNDWNGSPMVAGWIYYDGEGEPQAALLFNGASQSAYYYSYKKLDMEGKGRVNTLPVEVPYQNILDGVRSEKPFLDDIDLPSPSFHSGVPILTILSGMLSKP